MISRLNRQHKRRNSQLEILSTHVKYLKENFDEDGRFLDYKPRIGRPPSSTEDKYYRDKLDVRDRLYLMARARQMIS